MPSPAWKTLPTRSPCSLRELLDPAQDLGQARARDDAVLHVVVGRDPAHRRERRFAPLPEERTIRVARRCADLERAALDADALDLGGVVLDLLDHAVELDEQDGACADRVPGRHGVLGGLDRQPVHHLDRGRHHARGDDVRDGGAGRVHRVEAREQRPDGLRSPDEAERDPGRDPERALGADDHAEQVGPVRVERLPAELDDLAVRQHECQPGDVVGREPVLEAVRAAGVLGDVAADRAHLLARGVGRVEEALSGDGAGDVEVRHARLDDDALAREVDLEDPVHSGERHDDAAWHGRRAARKTGAGPARDEWHALAVTRAKHRLDVLGRSGKDDELGDGAVAGQPVALVDTELLRLGDDVRGAERRP